MSDKSKIGKMSATVTNSAGKKVDEWHFNSPFGTSYRCVVKIFNHHRDGMYFVAYPMKEGSSAQGAIYRASTEAFEAIRATDINELKLKVEEAYRIYDGIKQGVQWEDWLEVIVDKRKPWNRRTGSGLEISYNKILKANLNGKEITINVHDRVSEFPKPKKAGEKDEVEFGGREESAEFNYVKATAENIQALDDMIAGLNSLHERVSAFVRQSADIGAIDFKAFSGLSALPKPESE